MRSWDPMRNFPELDGLDPKEAEKLRRDTQKKISRQPVIFVGLLVTATIAAIAFFSLLPTRTVFQTFIAGGLVGLAAVVYMVLVIKPKMQAEFRTMGFPRSGAGPST
jgi:hypothetical protein